MKNYDDLQRFKEKTQTLDIAFKDMSGQSQDAGHSQWAIIRQLATDEEPELGSGQRVDLPQPEPIRGDEFSAPAAEIAPLPASARPSLMDSLASLPAAAPAAVNSGLFPPAKPATAALPLAPKATHVERQTATSLFPPAPAKPAVAPAPVAAPAEPAIAPAASLAPAASVAPPAAPSRFGALFRSRPAEPVHLSKETPLKPLLEKIALCR